MVVVGGFDGRDGASTVLMSMLVLMSSMMMVMVDIVMKKFVESVTIEASRLKI